MKTIIVLALALAVHLHAADALTERLQRGLFEEEANRNLDAAIKEYQAVVTQSDEQRKVTATALFRLGECYRKLGKTNEAVAFYQRITRDFSEQEQLVKLSRSIVETATPGATAKSDSTLLRALETKAAELRADFVSERAKLNWLQSLKQPELRKTDEIAKDALINELQRELLATDQKLAALEGRGIGQQHPDAMAARTTRETIERQIVDRIIAILTARLDRVRSLETQVKAVESEFAIQSANASSAQPSVATGGMTQAEAEELARVKTLARNSPDLLNAPARGLTELQNAARGGHYSVAEFLLSQGVKPNDPTQGHSPLVEAAQRGHLRIVKLLLDQGATKEGASDALVSACESGFKSVAELLLARGADVNRRTSLNMTPLHFAAYGGHEAIVEMLVKRGATLEVLSAGNNAPNGWPQFVVQGATPLHLAVERSRANIVRQLLDAGANAGETNREGRTALHLAAANGWTNLCALLLDRGANPNVATAGSLTPLAIAIERSSAEVVALLLLRGADPNTPTSENPRFVFYPLHRAVAQRSVAVLETMLAAKPNLEVLNSSGWTPLQQSVADKIYNIAELLLEAGANPNRTFPENYTLLHNAVINGRLPLVAALLKAGAKPNVVNRNGETPLSLALAALDRMSPDSTPGGVRVPRVVPGVSGAGAGMATTSYQWQGNNPGSSAPVTRDDFEKIVALLRAHGADEFLQRRAFINAVRGLEQRVNIFSKGTNDVNRYTLMEFLAAVYELGGTDFPFPDFAKITIHRVAPWKGPVTNMPPGVHSVNAMATVNTMTPVLVNLAALLASTNCAGDVPLEWGDEVEIPMADHSVSAQWPGMIGRSMAAPPPGYVATEPSQGQEVFNQCLQRLVRFTAGGTNVTFDLLPAFADLRRGSLGNSPRSPFFRLSKVVLRDNRFRNLLRSSSDLSRVTVTRLDPQTKETKKMTFDLNAVALPDMSYSGSPPPIPWAHDLWLRDGDVIEVPEKP